MHSFLVRGLLATTFVMVLSVATPATLFTANFDEFTEGEFAAQIVSGGVRFFNIDQNLGGGDNFTIEEANAGNLGAWFTAPNVLGFGGYVPGTGVAFGRLQSFSFDVPGVAMTGVSLDFWTFLLQGAGNWVALEGWRQGSLVDSDVYVPQTFIIDHVNLSLPLDDYDEFRIICRGSIDNGVLFADVDNVQVTGQPVPEPASVAALALGVLAVRRRTKR